MSVDIDNRSDCAHCWISKECGILIKRAGASNADPRCQASYAGLGKDHRYSAKQIRIVERHRSLKAVVLSVLTRRQFYQYTTLIHHLLSLISQLNLLLHFYTPCISPVFSPCRLPSLPLATLRLPWPSPTCRRISRQASLLLCHGLALLLTRYLGGI